MEASNLGEKVKQGLWTKIVARDAVTAAHSFYTAVLAVALAGKLGRTEFETIAEAGLFHDIGKLNLTDRVLKGNKALTDEDRLAVRTHPRMGFNMLRGMQFDKHVLDAVLYHHEKYNGRGYPYGLVGEEIPLIAQIISVCDVYTAMICDRPYRPALQKPEALLAIQAIGFADFLFTEFVSLVQGEPENICQRFDKDMTLSETKQVIISSANAFKLLV